MMPIERKNLGRGILLVAALAAVGLSFERTPQDEVKPQNSSNESATISTFRSLATMADPAQPANVDYQDKGAHFQYPNTWKAKEDKEFELHLIPAAGEPSRNITFDIPDLPPHMSWMITLSRIENGYIDDLKKQHGGLKVDSKADHPMNDGAAKARLVQSSWQQDGSAHTDVGLLIMRKDQVYILSCNAAAKDLAATRADFDKIVATLRWDK